MKKLAIIAAAALMLASCGKEPEGKQYASIYFNLHIDMAMDYDFNNNIIKERSNVWLFADSCYGMIPNNSDLPDTSGYYDIITWLFGRDSLPTRPNKERIPAIRKIRINEECSFVGVMDSLEEGPYLALIGIQKPAGPIIIRARVDASKEMSIYEDTIRITDQWLEEHRNDNYSEYFGEGLIDWAL